MLSLVAGGAWASFLLQPAIDKVRTRVNARADIRERMYSPFIVMADREGHPANPAKINLLGPEVHVPGKQILDKPSECEERRCRSQKEIVTRFVGIWLPVNRSARRRLNLNRYS
jgi:hypothetical protein